MKLLGFVATLALGSALSTSAASIGYEILEVNGAPDINQQFKTDVTLSGNLLSFTFKNVGLSASSICDIYFDDADIAANRVLSGWAAVDPIVDSGAGVSFSIGASPGNLPGGNNANPDFVATFSADSNPKTQPNGVNNSLAGSEWVTMTFSLNQPLSLDQVMARILGDQLRIGLHIQGLAGDKSQTYVSNGEVPEPGELAILGAGLLGLAGMVAVNRRRALVA